MAKGFGKKFNAQGNEDNALNMLIEPTYWVAMAALGRSRQPYLWVEVNVDGQTRGAVIGVSFDHHRMTEEIKAAFTHLYDLLKAQEQPDKDA